MSKKSAHFKEVSDACLLKICEPAGSTVYYYGKPFIVKEQRGCKGCVFYNKQLSYPCMRGCEEVQEFFLGVPIGSAHIWGPCSAEYRADGKSIIFKPVKWTKRWLKEMKKHFAWESHD